MASKTTAVVSTAKSILHRNWPAAVSAVAILAATLLVSVACGDLAGMLAGRFFPEQIFRIVSFALFFIIGGPLFFGVLRYFWRNAYSDAADFNDLFYYFSSHNRYFRAIRFEIAYLLRTAVYAFFCFLPLIVISLLNASWVFALMGTVPPVWAAGLEMIQIYLVVAGFAVFVVFAFRLYLSPMLAVIDQEMTALEALHISAMLSKYSLSGFANLCLRLLGWILLLLFGLPALYTVPLFIVCYIVHVRYCITDYNNHCEQSQKKLFSAYASEL